MSVLLRGLSSAACFNSLIAKMVGDRLGSADFGIMTICMIGGTFSLLGTVTGAAGLGNIGVAINLLTTMVTAWTGTGDR